MRVQVPPPPPLYMKKIEKIIVEFRFHNDDISRNSEHDSLADAKSWLESWQGQPLIDVKYFQQTVREITATGEDMEFIDFKKKFDDLMANVTDEQLVAWMAKRDSKFAPVNLEADIKPVKESYIINARCYSDDRCVEATFDALPWFEDATDTEILELANIGWGGNVAADNVAHYMADQNEWVCRMFDYIALRAKMEVIGFECHIDARDAMNWLRSNRSELYSLLILKEYNDV